jgi:hypothetical protein
VQLSSIEEGGQLKRRKATVSPEGLVWFILLPATQSLADFVIGARRKQNKNGTRRRRFKIKEIKSN